MRGYGRYVRLDRIFILQRVVLGCSPKALHITYDIMNARRRLWRSDIADRSEYLEFVHISVFMPYSVSRENSEECMPSF